MKSLVLFGFYHCYGNLTEMASQTRLKWKMVKPRMTCFNLLAISNTHLFLYLPLYSSGNTFSSFSGITVEERDGSVVECFTQD